MPLDLDTPDDFAPLTLEGYVRALDEGGFNLTSQAGLVESAPLLKRLAANPTFLVERMFDELRDQLRFQAGNAYAPEVLMLYSCRDYFIRANIWKPISAAEAAIPGYRYDVCHDHNFDILTVGYLGAGYHCRSYTYDFADCEGRLGEVVDLVDEGTYCLTRGRVALYRAKEDVHIQMAPASVSVSLNLIPRSPIQHELQFQFDEDSQMITRYLSFSGLEATIRLADVLASTGCPDNLTRIGGSHPSARVRALAFAALIRAEPEREEKIMFGLRRARDEDAAYLVGLELAR